MSLTDHHKYWINKVYGQINLLQEAPEVNLFRLCCVGFSGAFSRVHFEENKTLIQGFAVDGNNIAGAVLWHELEA